MAELLEEAHEAHCCAARFAASGSRSAQLHALETSRRERVLRSDTGSAEVTREAGGPAYDRTTTDDESTMRIALRTHLVCSLIGRAVAIHTLARTVLIAHAPLL